MGDLGQFERRLGAWEKDVPDEGGGQEGAGFRKQSRGGKKVREYRLMLTPYEIEVVKNAVWDKLQTALNNREIMEREQASDSARARNEAFIIAAEGVVEEIGKKDLDGLCYYEERESIVLRYLQAIISNRDVEENKKRREIYEENKKVAMNQAFQEELEDRDIILKTQEGK